jgi:hypothetical protein
MTTRINLNGIHELKFPTGVTSASTAGGSTTINLAGNADGIALETNGTPNASQTTLNLVAGANVTLTSDSSGDVTIAAASGAGAVTSVALAAPSRFTVTGSPVTGSGTLTFTENTQAANEVFAGPTSGSATTPSFRSLVPADLPLATASAPGAVQPDGTSVLVSSGLISVVKPYDIAFYLSGKFTASQTCMELNVARGFSLPASLTGSIARLDTAPAASLTFSINHNGVGAGTISFASGSQTGTFSFTAAVTFAAGDTLSVVAPTTADTSAAGLSVTFLGTRS